MGTVKALDWLYKKGQKEMENEDYDNARKRFSKILQMTRDSNWIEKANAGLAEIYLEEGNLFWSMDHIHRALKNNPNKSHYHYIKGLIHLRREEWEQAADEGVKAVDDHTENGSYYYLLGKALYHVEGYESASRLLDWAVECSPEDLDIQFEVVGIEIEQGHFQKALKILKRALDTSADKERIRDKMRVIQEHWKITGS
ncbi:MAG: tetratricopeptide repeat protein [bacterium]